MAERIELEFEGDENDALAAIERLDRVLERFEKTAYEAGRAADSIDVDLEDDIRQVQRMERAMSQLNREMMKSAGLRFLPGGAGGGGSWGGGPLLLGPGPRIAGPATPDSFARAVPASYARPSSLWERSAADGRFGDSIAAAILGMNRGGGRGLNFPDLSGSAFSGFGGGGGPGQRSRGGGFFSYGSNDASLQAGDLFRGILPGGAKQSVGAMGMIAAGAAGLGAIAAPGAGALGIGAAAGIGTLAANIAAISVAMRGLGSAIDGDYEAFKKLNPEAQKFVQEIRSFIPYADKLRTIAGEGGIWEGMSKGLNSLLSPAFTKNLESGLAAVSGQIGSEFQATGSFLGSDEMSERLGRFLQNSTVWTHDFAEATRDLFDAITELVDAGAPLLDWMSQGIADGAEWVQMWVEARVASGEFTDDMEDMKESFRVLGDFAGSLIGFIAALAETMAGPMAVALERAGDGLDELARVLEENRDEIQAFVEGGINAAADAIEALWPVVKELAGWLNAVVEAVGGWEVAFEILITGLLAAKVVEMTAALALMVTPIAAGSAAAGTLLSRLNAIAAIGAIGLTIYINRDDVTAFFDELGQKIPGFGGGGDITSQEEWDGQSQAVKDAIIKANGGKMPVFADTPAGSVASINRANRKSGQTHFGPVAGKFNTNLGAPGGGTHSRTERGYVWEDDDAVDIEVTERSKIQAVVSGTLYGASYTDGGGRFGGWGVHLRGDDGNEYFYKHMARLYREEGRVEAGEVIGLGSVNGHLHFAKKGATTAAQVIGAGVPTAPTTTTGGSGVSPAKGTPPPFDKNVPAATAPPSGMDLLTQVERQALTRAERSVSPGDNIKVLNRIVGRLTGLSGRSSGEAKTLIDEQVTTLLGMLDDAIEQKWDEFFAKRPRDSKRDGVLAANFGVDEDVVKDAQRIGDRMMDAIEETARKRSQQFADAFRDIARSALEAFDDETRAFQSPWRQIAEGERDARDTENLQRQLADAERDLEEARRGRETTTSNAEETLRKIGALVSRYDLANKIGKVQAGVLGIQHVDAYDEEFSQQIGALQRSAFSGSTRKVDEEEVRRAEERVGSIRFSIRQQELIRLADAEEAAYARERALLRNHLDMQLQMWMAFYSARVASGKLNPNMAAFATGLAANKAVTGVDATLAPDSRFAGEFAKIRLFADGGIAERPMMGIIGERGREAVIPLDSPRAKGMLGGNVQVNLQIAEGMEWLRDFVQVEVLNSAGELSSIQGAELDRRRRAGTF